MKRIIHFKEQCHPHLATEIHFSLGGFCISKQFLRLFFFFFFGLVAFFPLIFAVFHFVLVKRDTENGQKEDGNSIAHPHLLTELSLKPPLHFSLFFIPVGPD